MTNNKWEISSAERSSCTAGDFCPWGKLRAQCNLRRNKNPVRPGGIEYKFHPRLDFHGFSQPIFLDSSTTFCVGQQEESCDVCMVHPEVVSDHNFEMSKGLLLVVATKKENILPYCNMVQQYFLEMTFTDFLQML